MRSERLLQIFGFHGLERIEWEEAVAGQIIAFTGLGELQISDTVCAPDCVEPPALKIRRVAGPLGAHNGARAHRPAGRRHVRHK